jgi:hypothetical protein
LGSGFKTTQSEGTQNARGGMQMFVRHKIRGVSLVIIFLFFSCLALAQEKKKPEVSPKHLKTEEEFTAECKPIFEQKCIQCHTLERIKSTKKGMEWWFSCTKRMAEKPGAKISRDDLLHIFYYILREMPPPGP